MLQDSEIIISDTSCLIILSKINELELLQKVGTSVYITPSIQLEFGNLLPNWILISEPKNITYQNLLELELDQLQC